MTEPTKADLQEALARVQHERDSAHRTLTDLDGEARAVSACVRALNPLTESNRSSSYGFQTYSGSHVEQLKVARVLRYLAERYGVSLVEVRTEVKDCERPHLEDASEGQLIQALKYVDRGRL